MKILIIALICLYAAFNLVTAKLKSAKEMKKEFVDGQCIVGKIAANIFYIPAWVLKGLKIAIDVLVK